MFTKRFSWEEEIMNQINVDFNNIKGVHNKYATFCVGAGRAGEVLRSDFDKQLKTISEECRFKYLRFHGIFHDELDVYKENEEGKPIYNWQYVDKVYDAVLEKGMKPFVELSFMPNVLASGEQTVFWWKANVTPPKDYNKWYDLIYNFVQHLEERYGRKELLTWYFEVWNEPSHPSFFSSDMKEYFKIYDCTAKAVKDVCSKYRVGGPATDGNKWIDEMIDHCFNEKVPLDFISTHSYGVKGSFDEFGRGVQTLYQNKNEFIDGVKGVKEAVLNSPMPDLEVHYTEWSSCYSSRDPIHDNYFEAAYILHQIKNLEGVVEGLSYWTFTDVFEESGPPPSPFHGGFGLINHQALKKSAYFSYKFISELGKYELVNENDTSWVCRNDDDVQALLWNYTIPNQNTYNQKFYNRDIPSKEIEPMELIITNLPEGKYYLEVYHVGYGYNDVYTEYLKLGAPKHLSRELVKELDSKNCGKANIIEEVSIKSNRKFSYRLQMNENDIYFLTLKKHK